MTFASPAFYSAFLNQAFVDLPLFRSSGLETMYNKATMSTEDCLFFITLLTITKIGLRKTTGP